MRAVKENARKAQFGGMIGHWRAEGRVFRQPLPFLLNYRDRHVRYYRYNWNRVGSRFGIPRRPGWRPWHPETHPYWAEMKAG